jgi:hypothetical protein
MDAEANVKALGALRIAVGLVSWLTPNLAARLFGLDAAHNRQAPYLARLFGVRDLVLGVVTLTAKGPERRRWLLAGMACDAADAAAAGLGYRDGYLPAATTAMLTAPALAAVGMGVKALGDDAPPAA